MLDIHQRADIQAAIGYLLDEDHATAELDGSPSSWLEEKTGCTAEELRAAAFELAHPQTQLATSPGDLVTAARQLNENLPDSLPQTDDVRTRADVQEQLRTVREHEQALERELARDALRTKRGWLVPAPWDGPELVLDPVAEGPGEPGVPAAARALWVLQELAELVETEPSSSDPEQLLARLLLAVGALHAAGAGTLSQCMRTAAVWERG